MSKFRTLIITKKAMRKASAALMIILAAAGLCVGLHQGTPDAVPVFSNRNTVPDRLLRDGIPTEDEPFDAKGFLSAILGFDTNRPETILSGSSEIFNEASSFPATPLPAATQSPITAEGPQTTEGHQTADTDAPELPSHEAIINAYGLDINNATGYSVDLNALAAAPLDTVISGTGEPEVLIMHTHTTECYAGDEMSGESERTTNEELNVCAVGDVLAEALESRGIHTIHDKTIHDYPSFQGSYTRALNTITADMEKYPSVKVIIDLHRDAYVYEDGTKLRVTAEVDGDMTAQAMLVLGTDSMGLYHPYWRSNLSLAAKIQSAADIMYPELMRPINLRRERFNMHVTKGSLLIEIGSNGNTLSEAKKAASRLGDAIAAALLNG